MTLDFPPSLIGLFLFLLGSCVGSFLNVVAWRLLFRGQPVSFGGRSGPLTLSWPPSHCPNCKQGIKPYHNIPMVGWFMLRGRCAHCREPISLRYPLVELAAGLMFLSLYLAYYHTALTQRGFVGLAHGGPTLALHLLYVVVLLAASAIDADWFEIPLVLTNVLMAAALVWCVFGRQPMLPQVSVAGPWGRMALGGALGVVLSLVLLHFKLLPRSFDAEHSPLGAEPPTTKTNGPEGNPMAADLVEGGPPAYLSARRNKLALAAVGVLLLLAAAAWWRFAGLWAAAATLLAAILIFLVAVLPQREQADTVTQIVEQESESPDARREAGKELLFLLVPVTLAIAAALVPLPLPTTEWLDRLAGALLGLEVGGLLVWLTRILGTLAMGRVAMGLGDVHLMAAVGAVVGAKLVVLAFFMAPFFALAWTLVCMLSHRIRVLPYGPWLSMAAIMVLLVGHPILHWYMNVAFGTPVAQRVPAGPVHWPGEPP
ncbi:MAG: A24 family peptidase [Phycisphaerales bacterium]|nr:A24 family peptidase [Phycisphaerales bacterium]